MADPMGRDQPSKVQLPAPGETRPATSPYDLSGPFQPITLEGESERSQAATLNRGVPIITAGVLFALSLPDGQVFDEQSPDGIPPKIIAWSLRRNENFIADTYSPAMEDAMRSGYGVAARALERGGISSTWLSVREQLDTFTATRSGELLASMTRQQRLAMRAILRQYLYEEPVAPRILSRLVRDTAGLTERQALSLVRLRQALMEEGLPASVIERQVSLRADSLARYRADMIARTELVSAHAQAQYATVQQAVDLGYYAGEQVVKRWITAEDERVCSTCGALGGWYPQPGGELAQAQEGGTVIPLDDTFPGPANQGPTLVPPIHPNCRCVVVYETVS